MLSKIHGQIKKLKSFCETGSVLDKPREKQRSVLTPEVVEDIAASVTRSPHKSLRRLSREKNISLGSAHTAVRRILKWYPYRTQVFYELKDAVYVKRVGLCQWFKSFIRGNINVLDELFFTLMKLGFILEVILIAITTRHGVQTTHTFSSKLPSTQKNRPMVCGFKVENNRTFVF